MAKLAILPSASGADPWHFETDPDLDRDSDPAPDFFRLWLTKCQQKISFWQSFYGSLLFEGTSVFKIKFKNKSQKGENKVLYIFLLVDKKDPDPYK